jgi:hypothetical protein
MILDKFDKASDGIVDLYRASFYLAHQSKDVALSFLISAKNKLGKSFSFSINKLSETKELKNRKDCLLWAEKILDEYKRLKMNL